MILRKKPFGKNYFHFSIEPLLLKTKITQYVLTPNPPPIRGFGKAFSLVFRVFTKPEIKRERGPRDSRLPNCLLFPIKVKVSLLVSLQKTHTTSILLKR